MAIPRLAAPDRTKGELAGLGGLGAQPVAVAASSKVALAVPRAIPRWPNHVNKVCSVWWFKTPSA